MAARRVGAEIPPCFAAQDRFRHDGAHRVTSTEEQHVERLMVTCGSHQDLPLFSGVARHPHAESMTDEIGAQTLQQSVNTNATNALAPTSSHYWQRLISNAAHHRLEILAHLAWKAEV